MDYGKLLRRSFDFTWKYKTLWVLGFFATSYGSLTELLKKIPGQTDGWLESYHPGIFDVVKDWILSAPGIVVLTSLAGSLILLVLFFIVMHFISAPGLIKSVFQNERGVGCTLKSAFKSGTRYFWRFLGLFIILFFTVIFFMAFLLVRPLIISIAAFDAWGLILLIFIIPIMFVGIFFSGNIYSLAQRDIVDNETPVFEAIGEGYHLLIKHLAANFIIFLIKIGLEIVIFIAGAIIIAICAIPAVLIGLSSTSLLIITLLIVIPIFILIFIVVEGFLGTFFNSLLTYFYFELRKLTPRRTKAITGINPTTNTI
jgi:hypothetical protein